MALRRPIPSNIKAFKGALKKCRTRNEPVLDGFIHLQIKQLDEVWLQEWERISRVLYDQGIISEMDMAALAAYCTVFSRWVKAEAALKKSALMIKTKNGNLIQSPLVGMSNKAMELMHKFLSEFGMGPSSRTRVNVQVKAKSKRFKILDKI